MSRSPMPRTPMSQLLTSQLSMSRSPTLSRSPMSQSPMSQSPISWAPMSWSPMSQSPMSRTPMHAPDAYVPVTYVPVTYVPVTHVPVTHVLVNHVLVNHVPVTHVPNTHGEGPSPLRPMAKRFLANGRGPKWAYIFLIVSLAWSCDETNFKLLLRKKIFKKKVKILVRFQGLRKVSLRQKNVFVSLACNVMKQTLSYYPYYALYVITCKRLGCVHHRSLHQIFTGKISF